MILRTHIKRYRSPWLSLPEISGRAAHVPVLRSRVAQFTAWPPRRIVHNYGGVPTTESRHRV